MVMLSANLQNLFDTHTSTEVWLSKLRRWVLLDPTFGGYFTAGKDRRLGAFELSRLLRLRATDNVYWHALRSRNSSLLSQNYMNPLDYFRYVGLFLSDGKEVLPPVMNRDAASVAGMAVLSPLNDRDNPFVQIRFEDGLHVAPPTSLGFAEAPWWAPTLVARAQQSTLSLNRLTYVTVAVTSTAPLTVNGYGTTFLNGRWTSPVIAATEINVVGANRGSEVRVFKARTFPRSREVG
jgi:hypothetical protein